MLNLSPIRLAQLLTYAGTLPIWGAVLHSQLPFLPIDATLLAITYGAVIVSFLSGIHWAVYLWHAEKLSRNLFITSNITALLAWLTLLLPAPFYSLGLLIWCFLYLLVLDWRIAAAGIYPTWFYALRRNATAIVVILLSLLMGVS